MARKSEHTEKLDKIIGVKIYQLRLASGLSRYQLAAKIGVTHQQLQKYEKGTNRVAAGRLIVIARALGKATSYFFDNIEESQDIASTQHQRMCIEVSRNFMKIKNPEHQYLVNQLARTLSRGA